MQSRNDLYFAMYVEAGFLIPQVALVDMATRLSKQLPTGAMIAIVIALTFFLGLPLEVLRAAWSMGIYVFVLVLLSLIERGAILRRMPERPHIEKIAARAHCDLESHHHRADVSRIVRRGDHRRRRVDAVRMAGRVMAAPGRGAIYFAIAAFDDWRVRGRRFAENPCVLFGYEVLRIRQLDPL